MLLSSRTCRDTQRVGVPAINITGASKPWSTPLAGEGDPTPRVEEEEALAPAKCVLRKVPRCEDG